MKNKKSEKENLKKKTLHKVKLSKFSCIEGIKYIILIVFSTYKMWHSI